MTMISNADWAPLTFPKKKAELRCSSTSSSSSSRGDHYHYFSIKKAELRYDFLRCHHDIIFFETNKVELRSLFLLLLVSFFVAVDIFFYCSSMKQTKLSSAIFFYCSWIIRQLQVSWFYIRYLYIYIFLFYCPWIIRQLQV